LLFSVLVLQRCSLLLLHARQQPMAAQWALIER